MNERQLTSVSAEELQVWLVNAFLDQSRRKIIYVIYAGSHSHHRLAAGFGVVLYHGRLYPYFIGGSHRNDFSAGNPRAKNLTELQHHILIIMTTHHATRKADKAEDVGEHLLEDAQALLSATAHVAEEKVMDARKRLTAAIEKGKETWAAVQEKAVAGAKATDQVIRENPYKSLAVAVGVGVIIGYLLRRRD
jgi:ElaB/YqjD/DUF883 family membrane-anchored ribosome-binding protein